MALARASRKIVLCTSRLPAACAVASVRQAGHWNYDWVPGPRPKNEAERRAAAKKYNLQPEDYKPFPEDKGHYGDYPDLPIVSTDSKDPHYPWDYSVYKTNYGEPLHEDYNLYDAGRLDLVSPQRYPHTLKWAICVGSILLFCGILYIFEGKNYYYMPTMPKQFPDSGRPHYTFQPSE